ncbi:hypothetical protein BJ742DRAFT_871591 [Cladochytrium replicatum]|nr:hypothetical protein BJ742DRAFT_871591 [Cladochytrium replicatum]
MTKILFALASLFLAVSAQDVLVPPGKTELIEAFRAVGSVKFVCIDGLWRFGGPDIKLYRESGDFYGSVVTDNTGEPVITEDVAVGNGVWSGKRTQVENSPNPTENAFQILFTKTEASGTGLLTQTDYVTQTEVKGGTAPLECNTTESFISPIEAKYSFYKKKYECVIVQKRARKIRH